VKGELEESEDSLDVRGHGVRESVHRLLLTNSVKQILSRGYYLETTEVLLNVVSGISYYRAADCNVEPHDGSGGDV